MTESVMPPRISVVMSVFNGERDLPRALESLLSQDETQFELILVNDGSTDGTRGLLDNFAARDSRIRVFHQANYGLTLALRQGVARAQGNYIARQDADDVSFPGRLRAQADYLDTNPGVALVSCWSLVTGPRGEHLYVEKRPCDPDEATRLLLEGRSGPPGHGSVMFRREAYELVGGYRPEFYYAQDSDLWLRLSRAGKFAYLPEVFYAYEISAESISGGLHGAKLAYAKLVDDCYALRKKGLDDRTLLSEFSTGLHAAGRGPIITNRMRRKSRHRANYFIGRCLLKNRDRRAAGYFLRCLRDAPLSMSAWSNLLLASAMYPSLSPGGEWSDSAGMARSGRLD